MRGDGCKVCCAMVARLAELRSGRRSIEKCACKDTAAVRVVVLVGIDTCTCFVCR